MEEKESIELAINLPDISITDFRKIKKIQKKLIKRIDKLYEVEREILYNIYSYLDFELQSETTKTIKGQREVKIKNYIVKYDIEKNKVKNMEVNAIFNDENKIPEKSIKLNLVDNSFSFGQQTKNQIAAQKRWSNPEYREKMLAHLKEEREIRHIVSLRKKVRDNKLGEATADDAVCEIGKFEIAQNCKIFEEENRTRGEERAKIYDRLAQQFKENKERNPGKYADIYERFGEVPDDFIFLSEEMARMNLENDEELYKRDVYSFSDKIFQDYYDLYEQPDSEEKRKAEERMNLFRKVRDYIKEKAEKNLLMG